MATPRPSIAFDELLTVHDLAELYCLTPREVRRQARLGAIPAPIKLGHRTCRWKASVIQAHLDSLTPRH